MTINAEAYDCYKALALVCVVDATKRYMKLWMKKLMQEELLMPGDRDALANIYATDKEIRDLEAFFLKGPFDLYTCRTDIDPGWLIRNLREKAESIYKAKKSGTLGVFEKGIPNGYAIILNEIGGKRHCPSKK